jgi:hypothetical protein
MGNPWKVHRKAWPVVLRKKQIITRPGVVWLETQVFGERSCMETKITCKVKDVVITDFSGAVSSILFELSLSTVPVVDIPETDVAPVGQKLPKCPTMATS